MAASRRAPSIERPALVVGVDLRPRSVRAIEHALGMLACGGAREVHLVHVLRPDQAADRALAEAVPGALAELARDVARDLRGVAWAHVRDGEPCLEIRRLAFDVGADIVVLGDPAPGRTIDVERYRPFSVLRAGSSLALESRPFSAARCLDCIHVRSGADGVTPFCPSHERRGTAPLRIAAGSIEAEAARVLH